MGVILRRIGPGTVMRVKGHDNTVLVTSKPFVDTAFDSRLRYTAVMVKSVADYPFDDMVNLDSVTTILDISPTMYAALASICPLGYYAWM